MVGGRLKKCVHVYANICRRQCFSQGQPRCPRLSCFSQAALGYYVSAEVALGYVSASGIRKLLFENYYLELLEPHKLDAKPGV